MRKEHLNRGPLCWLQGHISDAWKSLTPLQKHSRAPEPMARRKQDTIFGGGSFVTETRNKQNEGHREVASPYEYSVQPSGVWFPENDSTGRWLPSNTEEAAHGMCVSIWLLGFAIQLRK